MLGPSTVAVSTDVMCRQFSFTYILRPLRTEKKSGVENSEYYPLFDTALFAGQKMSEFWYLLHVFHSNCSSPWKIQFNRVYCIPNQYNINIAHTDIYIYIYTYIIHILYEYMFPIVIFDVVSPWDQSHQWLARSLCFATQVPPSIHATMEECRISGVKTGAAIPSGKP